MVKHLCYYYLLLLPMENNNVKTRDLSPFAILAVIATLFVLSGCNVAYPSIDSAPETPEAAMEKDSHSDGAAMEKMEKDGEAMEKVDGAMEKMEKDGEAMEKVDGAMEKPEDGAAMEKMEKDGEAMKKVDGAMEKDEVSLTEPVEAAVASYEAGAIQDFDQETFETALADGKKVLLDFYADWCPTCRSNAPVVKSAVQADGDVVAFKVNYDTEQALRSKYGVVSQSTYITIQNDQELGRALGAQSADTITQLLAK